MKAIRGTAALLFFFLALNAGAQSVYVENSDTQFNAGSHNSTFVSGSGTNAALGLDYYGRAAGAAAAGSDEWFNGAWKHRQQLLVTSSNTAALSNYTVPVTVNTLALISGGRMNADGSDIRFTTAAAAGAAPALGYYIESGLNTAATKIWIKAPVVNNGSNPFYLYYGSTAAAAGSNMGAAFLMGNDFNAANGSAPSSATWVNIQSAAPLASSVRDIQGNQLRIRFGSSLGLRHYGLRSAGQYSFASPRRYHADINARTGNDSWSNMTLCPAIYTYSYDQDDWVRFSLKHSASGPTFTVERSEYGTKTTLVTATALAAGLHGVDFLISSSSFRVLLDGAQVYSAANNLNFNSPYLYLEASNANAAYDEFFFDNVFVTPYAVPEPFFGSAGQEQGRRYPSGTFVSQAKNTGAPGTRVLSADWAAATSSASTLGAEMRAHDYDVNLATFTAAVKGSDPAVAGRFVQYRLALNTSDPRYTAALSSMALTFISPPSTPTSAGASAVDSWTINWKWADASIGQYQEEGFKLLDASGAVKGTALSGATNYVEAGLNPNTPYTRYILGYNAAGNGNPATVVKYTLPAPPSVACDKSTGTWLSGTLTCSNIAGFGPNGVTFYRYAWTNSPTYAVWSGFETQWTAGTLPFNPGSGEYYLHVKSYNADGAALADDATFGPYWYDKALPQVTGFSPSSAPWTNSTGFPVLVSVSDTGGSMLKLGRYKWTLTNDRPFSGWLPFLGAPILGAGAASVNVSAPGSGGQWYLHIEAEDVAGNVGYLSAGTYKLDVTNPAGTLAINGGAAVTPRKEVTLTLTYSDAESGVKQVQYRNVPGSLTAPELPQATSSWTLLPGDGSKTALYWITDNAGNYVTTSDTILLDSRTSLQGSALAGRASGVMGEPAETFNAAAALTWTPAGTPLAGKSVAFVFGGATHTVLTDEFGAASSAFDIPAASGSYIYSIHFSSFSTDPVYSLSSSTGLVTASQRPTSVTTEDLNGTSNTPFTAKATLKDFYTELPVTGALVTFVFEGSTLTANTNGSGLATVSFTAPIPVGFYDYSASYAGNTVYAARSGTGRVGVGLKVTSLVVPGAAALASSTFTAQATLLDGVTPVAGSSVTFVFQGSTVTAWTNGIGVATAAFATPASSGTYTYTAAFGGDATFAASAGAAAVTVSVRPLTLAPEIANGFVNAPFTARAVLSDGVSGAKVAGKAVVFVFEGSSATVLTDAAGVSSTTFASGAAPRETECYYYFAGDAAYAFAGSSAAVSIARRPTALAASDVSSLINSTFTAAAELMDTAFAPVPVAGRTIEFNFGGAWKTAVTDALGIASVTYPSGVSAGPYQFSATVQQDASYLAASDTATVSVTLRPAVLTAYPRFVFALDGIQVVADLKDGVTGDFIGGQPVTFQYNGVPQATTTVASGGTLGRAYGIYAGSASSGTLSYSATFPGNSAYSPQSSTAAIAVTPRSVNLSAFPVSAIWSTTFTATAEMRDGATSAVIPGKTVRIAFLAGNGYFPTSGAGVAVSTFTAPASTGTFNWFADFSGDAAYSGASSTGTVTIIKRSPTFNAILANKYVLDSVFFSATFFDEGLPVGGKNVAFYFQGSTLTAATNAGGMATAGPFASVSVPGSYGYTAAFAGDSSYSAQASSSTLSADPRVSRINVSGVSPIANSTFTLMATLLDNNWGTPLVGKSVTFSFQTVSSAAVTDANGIARVGYTAPTGAGAYAYSATFAGNTQYAGTSGSENVTVTIRPTALEMADYYPPASSTFTASAVLKDFTTGVTISTKTISFLFLGVTKTASTNAIGSSSTTYVTLSSTMTYPISASFAGDALYGPASISKTVYPGRRNTALQTSDMLGAVALDTFTVTARLKDYDQGDYLPGATVSFTFSGSTWTPVSVTDSTGTASAVFRAPASTGSYTYTATFSGTALYNGNSNTSAVFVDRRTITLEPSDLTSVPALSTFTALAVLRDGAVTLSTRTLTFVFVATKTAVTNDIGVASNTFTAPGSTGTFIYSAAYAGDALYKPGLAYGSIGVVLKPTVLEVLDVDDAVVGIAFLGTAKLRDIEQGNALVLAPKNIRMVFSTTTLNSFTSVGVATSSFLAPLIPGTYTYNATFLGDGTYGASQSTGTVTVKRRPVIFSVAVPAGEPYTLSTMTVKGTLVDGKTGEALADQWINIYFKVANATHTIKTDAVGIATTTFYTGIASGTYMYSGTFDGNASYNASEVNEQTLTSIKINPRTTSVQANVGNGELVWNYAFWEQSPVVYVRDLLAANVGISGLTVNFIVNSSTITGVTLASPLGQATSSSPFTGTYFELAGTTPATARFDGNQTYAASILPGGTNWAVPEQGKIRTEQAPATFGMTPITGIAGDVFPGMNTIVSATLLDWWNRPYANSKIEGIPVRYRLSTTPCTLPACSEPRTWDEGHWGTVNSANVATATITAPMTVGDYPIEYYFAPTASFVHWQSAETQRVLRVGLRPTAIQIATADPLVAGAQMPITIKVKLVSTTEGNAGVAGKTVVLTFNGGAPQNVTTVAGGYAQYTYSGLPVGNYTYTATFAGDPTFELSSLSPVGNVDVQKNTTFLTGTPVTLVPAGNDFTAKATLNILVGTAQEPAAGRTIDFTFPGQANNSAVTNAQGIAQVTFTSPQVPGDYNFTADLQTNANDQAASAPSPSTTVQVVKRRTSLTSVSVNPVYIQDSFTSTSTLTDLDAPPDIASLIGLPITFTLHRGGAEGDTAGAGTTAASPLGQATRVFLSPAEAGGKSYTAAFAGTALYAAVTASDAGVNVLRRSTILSASVEPIVPTNAVFTATVTLRDNTPTLASSLLMGPGVHVPVKFVYNNVTVYGTTDDSGVATAQFTAQGGFGDYTCDVTYEGNATYAPYNLPVTVHVIKRTTHVTGLDITNQPAGAQFTAQATLTDDLSGAGLGTYDLNFVFVGTATIPATGTTDGSGVASTVYTAPPDIGVYNYTACFAGDATYAGFCDNTNSVTVNVSSTVLSTPDGSVVVNEVFTATATLKGKTTGLGVPSKTIRYTYNGGLINTAQTNVNGVAALLFTPSSTGTFRLDVNFDGDASFYSSWSSGTVTVTRRLAGIDEPNVNTQVSSPFIATATLRDLTAVPSAPLTGQTVNFLFGGVPLAAVTNSLGIATVTYTAPGAAGSTQITASFPGNANYVSSATLAWVNVTKHDTQLTVSSGSATALEVFGTTATLKMNGTPLAGKAIQFSYKGAALAGSLTDASGRSFVQYDAGASSGPWRLDAEFNGSADPAYQTSTGSNTITVARRNCLVKPDNIAVSVYDVFDAGATFLDVANSSTPAGKVFQLAVAWVALSTGNSTATDSSGRGYKSFTAPASSGTYKVEAFFTGDATYEPSPASTATVTVAGRPSQLSLDDASTMIGRVFTATATLKNDGTLLGNKYVLFTFEGRTFNARTGTGGLLGVAVATYTVTLSTGATQINAVFEGDASYFNSNTATATVTATMRPTGLTAAPATAIADKVFSATAILKDIDALNVDARSVGFVFQGTTFTATTNGAGVATANITANVSTGTYNLKTYFAGDFKYEASSTTLVLTVTRRPTSMVPLSGVTVKALDVFFATATLRDLDLLNVPSKPVYFGFAGSTFARVTDGAGVAVSTWAAPASSGTYYVGAYFDGDDKYAPSTAAILVTNLQRPSGIALNSVTASALDLFKTTATLTDLNNGLLKISTRPVAFSFTFGGSTSAYTDGVGVATAAYTAAAAAGSYTMTGTFAGDATYASTTTAVPLTVTKRSGFISGQYVFARVLDVFIATGTFNDAVSSAPVAGRTMKFVLQGGATLTAVTNVVGVATAAFTAPAASGTYTMSTSFDGDGTYNPISVSASSVTLVRRDSFIQIAAPAAAIIAGSVPVTAALYDAVSLGPVPSKTVSLLFQGSTRPIVTSALGVAASTYTASLSSGTFAIQASFAAGDPTYNVTVASRAIDMLRYPTFISASSVTVAINEVFTGTATLTDFRASTVPAKALVFYFNSSSFTAVTNGLGVAYSTYAAAVAAGVYQVPVSFAGDALYASTGVFIPMTVNKRPSLLTAAYVPTRSLAVFTATATLSDAMNTSLKLAGQSVQFEFYVAGSTFTNSVTADGNGVAASTFTAPSASGLYQFKALFAGSAVNYAASVSSTVNVQVRPSALSLSSATASIDEVFRATATLTDLETLAAISTRTVTFTFGASSAALTDAGGRASVQFTAPASSGTFQLDSAFAGDATYAASSSTSALTVTRRLLNMAAPAVPGIIDEVFTATVTLTDALTAAKAAARAVSFALSGSSFIAVSDVNGVAVSTFAAPSSSGTYALPIAFGGDARFLPANTTAQLTVDLRPSALVPVPVTARSGEIFTATAAFTDVLKPSYKAAGRPVTFFFEGSSFTALTDALGVAVSTFAAPASSGTFALNTSFDGDSRYKAASAPLGVTVLRRLSAISLDNPVIMAMSTVTMRGTLTDKLNPLDFVTGRPVAFFFSDSTFTAVTGGDGVAVSTYAGPVSSGTYVMTASFEGDTIFDASSATSTVTVLQRPMRILIDPSAAFPFEQFVATATLVDDASSAAVAGQQITFELDLLQKVDLTDGVGVATAAYTPPGAFGVYELKASYAGDGTYAAKVSTGPVSVLKRPMTLDALAAEIPALDVFVASASLTDVRFSSAVAGLTVAFTFGSQSATVLTGADGFAYSTFTAPVSSGVYYYDAAFAGTSVYALAAASGAVTVLPRATTMITPNMNANTAQPFILSAHLVDAAKDELMAGYHVSSVTVEFKFKATPDAASAMYTTFGTSNDLGVATVTVPVGIANDPGLYYYTARFYGDPTYGTSSSTAKVQMGLMTSLVAFNVETYAIKDFTVNAKLTDNLSAPVLGAPIQFKFLGLPNSGLTDLEGSGIAASTFSAPASAGTYLYTAAFLGDTIYSASNATATVTVLRRPSSILVYPANITAFSSFTITTVLKDVLNTDLNISGRDVYIEFAGSTVTVNTAAGTGEASAQFFASFSSGTYPYHAWFDGDDTFAGTLSTGAVNISLMATNMLSYNITNVMAASTFSAKVQIKDNGNQPVKDLSVDFAFEGNFGMGMTDAQGIAEAVFTAPAASGTYTYDATFYGDLKYAGSSASGNVTVGPRPTMMFTPDVSSKLGSPLVLAARLIDVARQTGIEGKTVSYVFGGATITAVTDSLGVSSAAFGTPVSTGAFAYEAFFTGDGLTFTSSYSSAPVTIALNLTSIVARSGLAIKIYEPLAVDATLRDSVGLRLGGLPVVFTLQGDDQLATTDVSGVSTAVFSTLGLASTGTYTYTARFPGDFLYVGSSDTVSVDVQRRDTLLDARDKQSTPSKPFTAEARLTDNVNGSALLGTGLTGKPVLFEFFYGTFSATALSATGATGISTASFTAPASTGAFLITARFADSDPVYKGFLSSGTVTVLLDDGTGALKTKIRAEHVDTYITHVFAATATLTASEVPVQGKTLLFSFFNGVSTFTALGGTDDLGIATAAFTAPGSSGTFTYTAAFAGDLDYAAATGTATVTAALFPDSLVAQDVSAYIGENFTARAVLRDELTLAYVAGRTIIFEFADGVSTFTHVVAAVTSSTGSAEAVFATPAVPGSYSYFARFAGDALYGEALDTASVLIAAHGSSTFLVSYDVFTGTGEVVAASATLTSKGLPVPGKAVSITFQGLTTVSTTNALGLAAAYFTAPATSGTYVCSAAFAGDILYNNTMSTAAVQVVYRKQPAAPVFKVEVTSASVTLAWTPVTNPDQVAGHEVTGYTIEESASLRGVVISSVTVSSATLGYTRTETPAASDETYYLKVKTNLADRQESGTTLIVEIPSKASDPERVPNYYYMSPGENPKDWAAWVKIPGKVMDKLSGSAPFSINIAEKTTPGFLKTYEIKTVGLPSAVSSGINAGDKKGVKLSVAYPQQAGAGASAASSGQMALYWNNGVEWIKLGGELDALAGEVYTYSRTFGQFAVKAAPLSSEFKFTKVTPRIFSPDVPDSAPNGTTVNRAVFTYENPGCPEVTIRVFDITGALVRRNLDFLNCNQMVWNGRDQGGTAVKGGIYIYQIESGEKVVTGTVVVAK